MFKKSHDGLVMIRTRVLREIPGFPSDYELELMISKCREFQYLASRLCTILQPSQIQSDLRFVSSSERLVFRHQKKASGISEILVSKLAEPDCQVSNKDDAAKKLTELFKILGVAACLVSGIAFYPPLQPEAIHLNFRVNVCKAFSRPVRYVPKNM